MKKLTLLFAILLFCASTAFAQSGAGGKRISGTVLDGSYNNQPLISATIQVKGAESIGTVTDFDGNFTIEMPVGSKILIISSMGLATQEVEAKDGMTVILVADAQELETVVVDGGYSKQSKKSFSGSATVVDGKTLEKKNPSEISKALAGEVPGLQVTTTSGQPGSTASFTIRGVGSVNSSTAPLIVVDGIPYDGDLSSIDPSDIALTTVLKDATATSLYGSRGSNGVLLITTKKGTSGESGKIDVDFKYGANMRLIPMYETIKDPQQYVELAWRGIYNKNLLGDNAANAAAVASTTLFGSSSIPAAYNMWDKAGASLIDPTTGKFYTDPRRKPNFKKGYQEQPYETWDDHIFRIGQKMDATVKIHGGSDKTTYYTSFGYLKDEGYYIASDYNRFTARANVDHQAKSWLKGNLNMSYTYSRTNNPGQGSNMNNGFAYVNEIPAIYPVFQRDANGYKVKETRHNLSEYAYDYGDMGTVYYNDPSANRLYGYGINPAGALQLDKSNIISHQMIANGMLQAILTKDKALKLTTNFGVQYNNGLASELTNSYYGDAATVGRISKSQSHYMSFTMNQLLSYNKVFASDHSIDGFVAHETILFDSRSLYGGMNYTARPEGLEWGNAIEMSYMNSSAVTYALESYFASLNYSYKGRYFIGGNYRADGSSRFAKGNRWGHFGSVGAAWVLTEEDFLANVNILKNLKIKASWGVLGNQNVALNLFTDQYSISNVNNQVAYNWIYAGSPDLTWEKSNNFNAGIEFAIGNYLNAEIDYFYRVTSDMLFPIAVAPSLGYSSRYVNDGKLLNQGVEFLLNVKAVDTKSVKLNIRLNGSHIRNKMLEMPIGPDGERMTMNGGMSKGKSLYDYYMAEYMGVDERTGKALYKMYSDNNNSEYTYITDVYQYIVNREKEGHVVDLVTTETDDASKAGANYVNKTAMADLNGGFGFDLNLYGVDISATFMYTIGGFGYDGTYAGLMHSGRAGENNWHVDMLNSPTGKGGVEKPYEGATIPRLSNGDDLYANSASTRFLTSNTNLTLSNVRVGYSFPKKWMDKIKINNLNLWVSADNLFCLSARKGYIPFASLTGGSSSYQYTPLSTILGGIKIQF